MNRQHSSIIVLLEIKELYKRYSYLYRIAKHSIEIHQSSQENQSISRKAIYKEKRQIDIRFQEKDIDKRKINI